MLALLIVGCIYWQYGMYFSEDDVLSSYLFYLSGFSKNPHLFFYEEFFGIKSLISFLQSHFIGLNIYGIYKFSSLVLALFIFLDLVFTSRLRFLVKLLLLLFFLLLFTHYFIFINNVSLSFFFCFLSFFVLICSSSNFWKPSKVLYFYYFVLIFLAITCRFQIALVAHILILPFSLLFLSKKAKWLSFTSTVLFTILFLSYSFFSNEYPNIIRDFHHHELSVYDRNDLVIDEIYSHHKTEELVGKMDSTQITVLAKALFINDFNHLSKIDFTEALKHKTSYEFYFKNDNIGAYFNDKLTDFISNISGKFIFLLLALAVSAFIFIPKINIKGLFFISVYIFLPFLILIPASVPMKFIGIYIASGVFTLFLWHFIHSQTSYLSYKSFVVATILVASSTFHFHYFTKSNVNLQRKNVAISEKIYDAYLKDYQNNQSVFLAYFDIHHVLHGGLFFKYKPIVAHFVDLAGYIDYPAFANVNRDQFGKVNYNSLIARYQHIYHTRGMLYVSPFMKTFLKTYFREVYNYKIEFDTIKEFENTSIKKCFVSYFGKIE